VVLQRDVDVPYLALVGYRWVLGTSSAEVAFLGRLPAGAFTDPQQFGGFRIRWSRISSWTGLIVKKDPGAPIVWIAFLCLISGLTITFYFPRRRVWARLEGGRLQLAVRADRYVDVRGELAELVAAIGRRAGEPLSPGSPMT
jgi:cytochrome c biogenesis protein ResB